MDGYDDFLFTSVSGRDFAADELAAAADLLLQPGFELIFDTDGFQFGDQAGNAFYQQGDEGYQNGDIGDVGLDFADEYMLSNYGAPEVPQVPPGFAPMNDVILQEQELWTLRQQQQQQLQQQQQQVQINSEHHTMYANYDQQMQQQQQQRANKFADKGFDTVSEAAANTGVRGSQSFLVSSVGARVLRTSTSDIMGQISSQPLRITGLGLEGAAKRTVKQLLEDEFDGLSVMAPAPGAIGMVTAHGGLLAVNYDGEPPTRVQVYQPAADDAAPDRCTDLHGFPSGGPRSNGMAPDGTVLSAHRMEGGYIASAAPYDQRTSDEFWSMVWQECAGVIIMLCSVVENGTVTCQQYWPEAQGSSVHFGTIAVFHKQTFQLGDITCRSLLIRQDLDGVTGQAIREVVLLEYEHWPVAGIPATTKPVQDLIILSKKLRDRAQDRGLTGTAVVHCSNGLGRTGSFLACDICASDVLQRRLPRIPHTVHRLRQQRPGLVQSVQQHALVYAVIADIVRSTHLDIQRLIETSTSSGGSSQDENLLLSFVVMAQELAVSSERQGQHQQPMLPPSSAMMLPTPITDSGRAIVSSNESRSGPSALLPADQATGFSLNLRPGSTEVRSNSLSGHRPLDTDETKPFTLALR